MSIFKKRKESAKKRTPPDNDTLRIRIIFRLLDYPPMKRPKCVWDRIKQEEIAEMRK